MTTGLNLDFSQLFSKIESLRTSTGSSNGSASNQQFINSVFTLTQQGQAAFEGDDTQKAQAIHNIVTSLLSMIGSLGNENAKAKQAVNQNTQSVKEVNTVVNQTSQDVETVFSDIRNQLAGDTETITRAEEAIKAKQEEEQKARADLQKLVEEIKAQKDILNSDADSEEKEKALQTLTNTAGEIETLVSQVTAITSAIDEQNSIVQDAASNISTNIEKANTEVTSVANTLQANATKSSTTLSKSTVNATAKATGEEVAAETLDATTKTPVVGAAVAAQVTPKVMDMRSAASTYETDTTNIQAATAVIGKIGSTLQNLVNNLNAVGTIGQNIPNLIGSYDTQVNGLITATGSWKNVSAVNEELKVAITDYESKIGGNENLAQLPENSEDSLNKAGYQDAKASGMANRYFYTYPTNNSENNTIGNQEEIKFEFDETKFTQGFGV